VVLGKLISGFRKKTSDVSVCRWFNGWYLHLVFLTRRSLTICIYESKEKNIERYIERYIEVILKYYMSVVQPCVFRVVIRVEVMHRTSKNF